MYSVQIPAQARKIVVRQLSSNFRDATEIVEFAVPTAAALPPGHVLVKNIFVGINASDVSFFFALFVYKRPEFSF